MSSYLCEFRAEFCNVGEVARREGVHFHHLAKHRAQVREHRVLLLLLPHHHRHLRLEVRDNVRVHLGEARPLHQLVDFAHRRVARQVAQVLSMMRKRKRKNFDGEWGQIKMSGIETARRFCFEIASQGTKGTRLKNERAVLALPQPS